MNRKATLFYFLVLLWLCGYATSPSTDDWRKADEGTFTFEVPKHFKKRIVNGIDSHVGEYLAHNMRIAFDEAWLITKEKAQALQTEFGKEYGKQEDAQTGNQFFLKLGKRYAKVTIESDEKWVKEGYPGKHAVTFFCPEAEHGGYLSLWITYRNEKDTETALHIIKSVSPTDWPARYRHSTNSIPAQ